MPSWDAIHYKAIYAYSKRHGLRILIGSHPTARFQDSDGKLVQKNIDDVMLEYTEGKKEEARERKRLKVEEERKRPWSERFTRD